MMKTKEMMLVLVTLFMFAGAILISSCKKDEVAEEVKDVTENPQGAEDPDKEPDPIEDPNPDGNTSTINEINNALEFYSASFKSGTPPESSNLGDLKINKDTINIWPGIKNRIEILNHTGISIGGVLVQIPGADGYHDVDIVEEESTDTLAVFYVDLDPDGLVLPLNSDILLSPTNASDQVIDVFEKPVHGDPPFDEDISSGADGTGHGTCKPATERILFWMYSEINGQFENAPNWPAYINDYEVEGCCFNGMDQPCGTAAPNSTVVVNEQYGRTDAEKIYFQDDLRYIYTIDKSFNDYDPSTTDFCKSTPGYLFRNSGINTGGEYSLTPNSDENAYEIIIHTQDITLEEIFELGFPPEIVVNDNAYNIKYTLGCRYFVLRLDYGEGDTFQRVFENVEDDLDFYNWRD